MWYGLPDSASVPRLSSGFGNFIAVTSMKPNEPLALSEQALHLAQMSSWDADLFLRRRRRPIAATLQAAYGRRVAA